MIDLLKVGLYVSPVEGSSQATNPYAQGAILRIEDIISVSFKTKSALVKMSKCFLPDLMPLDSAPAVFFIQIDEWQVVNFTNIKEGPSK